MVLSWREPLGLFVVRTVIPDDAELVILPEPGPVNVTAGEPASGAHGGGRATFGFAGLREYEPGDPVRSIAWKRSASAGRLVVKRAPRSMVHAVMLVCDMASCTTDAQVDAVAYAAMSRYAGLCAGLERHGGKLIVTTDRQSPHPQARPCGLSPRCMPEGMPTIWLQPCAMPLLRNICRSAWSSSRQAHQARQAA
ncbi:DUF58 domain-containing protein [Bifidobacterium thermacidophilum]|uniref:DUF58 domain-containing protein n=1 Tax=Bifidobacterium thermacidophilum TaxID=246618 RepID=UPI0009DC273B